MAVRACKIEKLHRILASRGDVDYVSAIRLRASAVLFGVPHATSLQIEQKILSLRLTDALKPSGLSPELLQGIEIF
jgi:hypothetical protein